MLLDFLVAALATDALITAWFYGSIFEAQRKKLTEKGGKIGNLVSCSLCAAYHVAFVVVLLLWFPTQIFGEHWLAYLFRVPMYALAATDIVHWLQGDRPIPLAEDYENDDEDPGHRVHPQV